MGSSSSNRSPSPMSLRPNPNPNPNSRSQQEREGWKSFTGYSIGNGKPNTPANSPAEYGKKAPFSRDHEQKENERDLANLKSIARPRSPSVSKGSKNFMSPTISAASKINPSPRRKVLGDRNETIRTSASLSDGKFEFFSTMNSQEFSNENEPNGESENRATDSNQTSDKTVTEFSPGEEKIVEPDLVILSPELPVKTDVEINMGLKEKSVSGFSPSAFVPLDSEPSFPPYDPKTNFLSPRPQFLCYKPNPRIEGYINQGLRLEDQFSSETSSETESSGETQSENSSKEQEEDSFSSSSFETENPPSFESNPAETHKRFFTKWKTLAFALVFLLGSVAFSVTYNPSFGNAVFRDEVIARVYRDPHVVVDLAKVNFDVVFQRAKIWSVYSVDHLSQIIDSWREVNTFSPVLFSNLTVVWQGEEDYIVGDFEWSYFVEKDEETEEMFAENSVELLPSKEETEEQELLVEETYLAELDDFESEQLEERFFVLPIEAEVFTAEKQRNLETEEPEEVEENAVLPPLNPMLEEETNISADFQIEDNSEAPETEEQEPEENCVLPTLDHGETDISADFQIEDNSEGSSSNPEVHPQIQTTTEPLVEDDQISPIDIANEEMIEEVKTNSEMFLISTPKNQLLTTVSLVSVLILTLASAFVYLKPKNATVVSENSAARSVKEHSIYEYQPSCSGQVEVENMRSEPCPSEMSSFQKTSSQIKRGGRKDTDEAQSQSVERRNQNKRESVAESSSEYTMRSSSYGSFTTYSKIPSKKGDEEVVTPVRRSSRLRSQV